MLFCRFTCEFSASGVLYVCLCDFVPSLRVFCVGFYNVEFGLGFVEKPSEFWHLGSALQFAFFGFGRIRVCTAIPDFGFGLTFGQLKNDKNKIKNVNNKIKMKVINLKK